MATTMNDHNNRNAVLHIFFSIKYIYLSGHGYRTAACIIILRDILAFLSRDFIRDKKYENALKCGNAWMETHTHTLTHTNRDGERMELNGKTTKAKNWLERYKFVVYSTQDFIQYAVAGTTCPRQ